MRRLLSQVLDQCPKCPSILALQKLRIAARQFCQDTQSWEVEAYTDAFNMKAWEPELPTGTSLITVSGIFLDDSPLCPGLDYDVQFDRSPARIEFFDEITGSLEAVVVCQPSYDCSILSDFLVDIWGEAIVARTLETLLIIPGKPWNNPNMSVYWGNEKRKFWNNAMSRKMRGGTTGQLAVSPREFGT